MSFLRALFGPSKEEIWSQLAGEIGAQFHGGGFFSQSAVQAQAGDWIITLDTFTEGDSKNRKTYTRLRAPYSNPEGFSFQIYRASIFSGLGKALGMQDIEVGHPRFDQDFVIKGNAPLRVRRLLANDRIRSLIEAQPKLLLSVKTHDGWFSKFPAGVDELYFQSRGVIKDLPQLRDLFDLFAEVLNQVCHDGKAYEDDVEIHIDRLRAPGGRIEGKLLLWEGDDPRRDAAEALGRLGDPMGVPALVEVLHHDDGLLRVRAIDALAEIADEKAVPPLIPLLGDTREADGGRIRDRVADALRNMGEASLVDMVLAALAGDVTRLKAYEGEYRAQVIDALVNALEGLSAAHAAGALAELNAVEALPPLREVLRSTGTGDPTGQAIADAIKQLEARGALPRPAHGIDLDVHTLPRAAEEPGPDRGSLPRVAEGEE